MRYLVLMRHEMWRTYVALIVSRSQDGRIECVEPLEQKQGGGMTWWMDGRYALTSRTGAELKGQRTPLTSLKEPEVAYSIPGWRLANDRLPHYTSDFHGATIQVSAEEALQEPQRVALQLVLVPRGQEPYHRETVGDRCIEDGDPAIWTVLARDADESAERLVPSRVPRWPPPLRATVRLG